MGQGHSTASSVDGTGQEPPAPLSGTAAGLRVGVLGPLAVWRDGQPADPGSPRQRTVLGLLAASAGAPLHREALVSVIWPVEPPKSAATMVQSYVSALRRVLASAGPGAAGTIESSTVESGTPESGAVESGTAGSSAADMLVCEGGRYQLRLDAGQSDLAEFTEFSARGRAAVTSGDTEAACQWYERAVRLWRGEPLADLELARGHPLVVRLARRRTAVVLAYAEVAAAAGRQLRILPHLRDLADRDQLDERVHARLMIALAGTGQRAAALRVFDQLRVRLDSELGVGPGAELAETHAAILRGGSGGGGLVPPGLTLAGPALSGPALSGPALSSPALSTPAPADPALSSSGLSIPAPADPASSGSPVLPSAAPVLPVPVASGSPVPPSAAPVAPAPEAPPAVPTPPPLAPVGPVAAVPPGIAARLPRQLPPAARHFVGRAGELKELSELLDQVEVSGGTAVISAIGGTAGVGKTALAVYWAHRVADRFPDGQLYVNLRGFDPSGTPVRAADAARIFLDALGVPAERIPVGLDERAALLRGLLAGRRLLLLLDNARDAAQVRPLLPATPGCLTLITSRSELTGLAATHSAQLLSLDVLTGVEATELLERRLGRQRVAGERPAVAQLTRLCARLPLALSIIAARAAVRRDLPLAALVAELQDARGVLDALSGSDTESSIRAVFSWSCQQLGSEAARMFRLLGAHPGPDVSLPAAASLAASPVGQAHRVLAELTSAHLLAEHAPGRFTCHDLLRAYAAEQARGVPTELHAARLRMLDHYLGTGVVAALLLEPHRAKITPSLPHAGAQPEPLTTAAEALAWFGAELPVLLAVVTTAAAYGYDAQTWQLAWTLSDFLDWRGHWHDWEATQQLALAACLRLGDVEGQGHARRSLARACNEMGRYDDTRVHLREALALYRACGDALGQARSHVDMATVLERQSSYEEAISHAEQALELFRAEGHAPGQANALNAVGWCHAMAGHHTLALRYCQQAVDLQRELGDKISEAGTWDSLGYAHHHLGQYAEAVGCYRRALEFYSSVGHRRHQAEVLSHLAETQQASGDLAGTRESWRQALAILDDLHHPDAERLRLRLAGLQD